LRTTGSTAWGPKKNTELTTTIWSQSPGFCDLFDLKLSLGWPNVQPQCSTSHQKWAQIMKCLKPSPMKTKCKEKAFGIGTSPRHNLVLPSFASPEEPRLSSLCDWTNEWKKIRWMISQINGAMSGTDGDRAVARSANRLARQEQRKQNSSIPIWQFWGALSPQRTKQKW